MIFRPARKDSREARGATLASRVAIVVLALLLVPWVCAAARTAPLTIADNIEGTLTATGGQAVGGDGPLQSMDLLKLVYSDRHYIPGWVTGSGPRPIARAMVEVIRASRASGLRPADYHLAALERLLDVSPASLPAPRRARDLARFELLLSDALLRLANDEAQGRLDPDTFRASRPSPKLEPELQDALRQVFAGAPPGPVIEGFAPQDTSYRGMRAALARYRRFAASGEPRSIAGGPALVEGDSGPRVEALVRRLQRAGDMADSYTPDVFGPEVAAALRRYQARHGLRVDAVAGAVTLATLNKPAAYWVDRLRVNMERRRELGSPLPPTRLMVNIADFRATLFVGGKPQLAERVIVGKSYQETPEISSRIAYLVVNPSWEVPASIARKEILAAARKNPDYFSRHDYEVLQGWGNGEKRVKPESVDWKSLSAANLPFHFRQPAGPDNSLGRVKFMFTNSHDVYMHDTPARSLFDAAQRTFSHGCIRVDNAMRLAAALLRADGYQDPGLFLIRAADEGDNRIIELRRPIPIYIMYMTAWAKDLNTIEFRPDVYGRDARVLAALDAAPQSFSK